MTGGTIAAFESTLHKTNIWLKDLLSELGWQDSDHQRSYHALRAVLHALRDRLTVEEASDLAAQLPMLVRGFYYEGWNPAKTPVVDRSRRAFLQHVAEQFDADPNADAEVITRAVFRVISKHVTSGETKDIRRSLPEPIQALWD